MAEEKAKTYKGDLCTMKFIVELTIDLYDNDEVMTAAEIKTAVDENCLQYADNAPFNIFISKVAKIES